MVAEELTVETQDELFRGEARRSLAFFVQFCDPRYLLEPFHAWLCRRLEEVADGQCPRMILNTPPRHGKSRLAAIEFAAWMLGRNPRLRVIAASYSGHLSSKHSAECLARMRSTPYRMLFPAAQLNPRRQASGDWETLAGGGYLATSVTGSATGMGADLLVVDDPIKDFQEAHSPTYRERVWNWFLSTASTRLSPDGLVVVIMTRWHKDDLVGRLTDPDRVEELEETGGGLERYAVLNLPALGEKGDVLGRGEGEALAPARYSAAKLRTIRASVGSYLWSCLYRGQPVAKGGNYVNAANFKVLAREVVPEGLLWMRYWDLAASEKVSADYTVGLAGAVGPDPEAWRRWVKGGSVGDPPPKDCLYLRDMVRGQWLWPKARTMIAQTAAAEQILVGVEAQGGFQTAYANLREVLPWNVHTTPVTVATDKLTRALPWIAQQEAGKVFLVAGDWITDYRSECEAFPSGAHDDQVDATSGVRMMLGSGRTVMVA